MYYRIAPSRSRSLSPVLPEAGVTEYDISSTDDMKDVIIKLSYVLTTVVARLEKVEKGQNKNSTKSPSTSTPQRPKVKVSLVVRVSLSFLVHNLLIIYFHFLV